MTSPPDPPSRTFAPARPLWPSWGGDAPRVRVAFDGHAEVDALVAHTPHARRTGWSDAGEPPPERAEPPPFALFFAFDVEGFHGFWLRDVPHDVDLVQLDRDGVVVGVAQLAAGSETLVPPPEPILYALELPAGLARALGAAPGVRLRFDRDAVAPAPPEHEEEPPITPAPDDDDALVVRWSQRQHAYASRPYAAAAAVMGWQLRVGPEDIAIWLHAGGGFVLHPPICPLGPLEALARSLGLRWLRLELGPYTRLRRPDGEVVVEPFDPRAPNDWLARMRAYGLHATTGRWQQTRTLVRSLEGTEDEVFARLPTRIRYEARTFQRALDAGDYRLETAPAAVLDKRQQRAFDALHAAWLAARPDAEDNLTFCNPIARTFRDALTAYLVWQGTELLAVQYHLLWQGTFYYLFSEAVAGAPQGLTPGLLWHGIRRAKAAPFGPSPAPDMIDLVGAFDPRYPEFRAFGKGFTASKLRWHPTTVWLPPSVAFAGMELPP